MTAVDAPVAAGLVVGAVPAVDLDGEPDGVTFRWYHPGCGRRSFCTFESAEQAAKYGSIHEESCHA